MHKSTSISLDFLSILWGFLPWPLICYGVQQILDEIIIWRPIELFKNRWLIRQMANETNPKITNQFVHVVKPWSKLIFRLAHICQHFSSALIAYSEFWQISSKVKQRQYQAYTKPHQKYVSKLVAVLWLVNGWKFA